MLLGGTTWFLEHRGDGDNEAFSTTPLAWDTVRSIEIARPGRDTIRLEKRDSGWEMVLPLRLPANAAQVSRVLDLLAVENVKLLDAPDADRARFGLAPPRMSISFGEGSLLVGDPHPYNLQRYIETDSGIYLAADRFSPLFGATTASFADRELVPPGSEILSIETPGWKIYRDKGRWRIDPGDATLSADRITAKVDAWRSATATEIRRWSGETPGKPVRLQIAGSEEGLQFNLVRQAQSEILVRTETGLAYELPGAANLLEYPGLPGEAP